MPSDTLSRPRLLLRGLDSLYVAYFLDLTSRTKLDLDELAFQRERLQRVRNGRFAELVLGPERFALQPYGKHPYKYVLTNKAFEVRLGEHMRPSAYVQFFSEALWRDGVDALLARFEAWCAAMGFVHTRPNSVSRADWAFDYDLPAIDFHPDHFVSRAQKNATWRQGLALQTVTFGSGDVVIRVYDKVAEIDQQSGKAWFHELWSQKQDVWRVEFQVRGKRLDAASINTIDDLKSFQHDLLRELATNHTTLRRPSSDSNRARWPLHPLWQAVQDDIASLPQSGLVRALDPQRPLNWRLHQQAKALYGTLKGIGAVLALQGSQEAPPRLDEVLSALPQLLEQHHVPLTWVEDIERRVTGYALGQW